MVKLYRVSKTASRDAFQGAQVFSKLDLTSGFWQIPVESDHQSKTAFSTRQGKQEFCVMPFSSINAPATFQDDERGLPRATLQLNRYVP